MDVAAAVGERQEQLRRLHREDGHAAVAECAHLMTEQLHIAVRGSTWARPESPEQVWMGLLAEVAARCSSTAFDAAIAHAFARERQRIIVVARQMGATYPVTLHPRPGHVAGVETAFPFADYLEDVPVDKQGGA